MLSLSLLIVMLPALLMAFSLAVALIFAPSPMVTVGELMVISPPLPLLSVSVVRVVPVSRVKLLVSILISPAFPAPVVEAVISIPSDIMRFWVSISMVPALPAPVVSTDI